jgi:hypothetical protein
LIAWFGQAGITDKSGPGKLSVKNFDILQSLFIYAFALGYKEEEFNWQTYLKTCKAQAAPKSLFENQNIVSTLLSKEVVFECLIGQITSDNKEL